MDHRPDLQDPEEDGRSRRARERRLATRESLVQAAAAVFAQDGYLNATPTAIAEQAGVTRATFYQHFPSKAEAFGAVLDDVVARLQDAVRGVDLGPEALPPELQLAANLLRVLDILLEDRALARLLLLEAGKEPLLDDRLRDFHGFVRGMMREALQDGQPAGLVRPLRADLVAHALFGAVQAVMVARLEGQLPQTDRGALARELLQFCLCGVAASDLRMTVLDL